MTIRICSLELCPEGLADFRTQEFRSGRLISCNPDVICSEPGILSRSMCSNSPSTNGSRATIPPSLLRRPRERILVFSKQHVLLLNRYAMPKRSLGYLSGDNHPGTLVERCLIMLRLAVLTVLLLVVLQYVGCSDVSPTTTTAPTATNAPEINGEDDGEVMTAAQRLFDTWNRAHQDKDAALFRSILSRDIATRCGQYDLQSWLDQDLEFHREVVVRSVFVDIADPSRALADIVTMRDVGQQSEPPIYPWPLKREDGGWRAGFLYG